MAHFESEVEKAREGHERFVSDGIVLGSRPELVGGELIRSHGNWSQVVSLRKKGEAVSYDARILGSSDFVDQLLSEMARFLAITTSAVNRLVSQEALPEIEQYLKR